ncbi:hypothetical protein [Alienimonas californiensis]|uniref:Uncharacterized protein n=1 Tax=Alienimonas californiensis TaxID=2527989 RepID=A0A517P4A0_9PLAN|nr:hypothetical protein [Alienimonas californiensis]QDT14214.1 hypothetical protein CA12_02830 [Alienimonas californiensis]
MLKLNCGLSRKVGQPDYGSRGAQVHLEVELSAELLKDPEKLRRQIRGCFGVVRRAVDAELGVADDESGEPARLAEPPPDRRPPSDPPSTDKQVRALHAFARRAGADLAAELRRLGVTDAAELSRRQASGLIDGLKERAGDRR